MSFFVVKGVGQGEKQFFRDYCEDLGGALLLLGGAAASRPCVDNEAVVPPDFHNREEISRLQSVAESPCAHAHTHARVGGSQLAQAGAQGDKADVVDLVAGEALRQGRSLPQTAVRAL